MSERKQPGQPAGGKARPLKDEALDGQRMTTHLVLFTR